MDTKTCKQCSSVKALEAFPKHKGRKDGRGNVCKVCDAARAAAWRDAHPGANAAQSAAWRKADPERARASDRAQYEKEDPVHRKAVNDKWHKDHTEQSRAGKRAWKKANPEKNAKSNAESRRRNPEPSRASARRAREAHPEKARAANRKWAASHPQKRRESARNWGRRNRDKCCAYTVARKARKLHATPTWADWGLIDAAYTMARAMTDLTGVKYHVDHIVPLQSKLVCGLHVGCNLQLLTNSQNSVKGNRHWPDMP